MTEEERLREIARRPSPLKGLLDIGSTLGTYGVEKMREMPSRAVKDIESAVTVPAKSAYHAAAQITGQEPYDRDEAIRHALNIANAMTLGAGAYEAPEAALRAGLSRPRENPLLAVHETYLDRLKLAQRQGGLPARSTGIINPEHPFGMFGDISLIGGKEWATPQGGHHRVFHGDPHTPNPSVRERPVEDVVASVRQQPYRLQSESVNAPETVRAYLTPEFQTFEDVKGKSNLLTSRQKTQEYKDLSNQFMEDIRERMAPYYSGAPLLPEYAAHRAMVDPDYRSRYFKNLPADIEEDIAALPSFSAQAPQHYFEAKNYGIANIGHPSMEYKGAIVPHDIGPQARNILRDFGIRDIYHTDTDDPEKLVRAYEQFKHLQFADGGSVKDDVVEDALRLANHHHYNDSGAAPNESSQENFLRQERAAYASGGQIWDKPRPKSLGKPEHLSAKQKSKAKAAAKAAGRPYPNLIDNMRAATPRAEGGSTPAWQRAEGKNPEGGLNAKGRASYNRQNPGKPGLKPPAPHPKSDKDAARRASFCARMKGMKAKLTSSATANDPDSRINKSLRAWNCRANGGLLEHPDISDALRIASRQNYDDGGAVNSVSQDYSQYLGQAPDAGGLSYWQNAQSRPTMPAPPPTMPSWQPLSMMDGSAYPTAPTTLDPMNLGTPMGASSQIPSGTRQLSQDGQRFNPLQFVGDLYQKDFGRTGDTNGTDYWTNQIKSGAMTPEQVARAFETSPEYSSSAAQQYRQQAALPFVGKHGGGSFNGPMPQGGDNQPWNDGTGRRPDNLPAGSDFAPVNAAPQTRNNMPFVGKHGGGSMPFT